MPLDGKDHEPKVRLLQCKVPQAIRALPDTPAKNITSIRKALSKSTKLSYKAMAIKETLALSFSTSEIDAMTEYEMFDHFLEKCQEGLNLSEMLEEQISVCKRELIQNKGESAADFAARAESTMSLFEELLKGSGFTNDQDGVDKYSTDRKRSQAIITGLRPVYFGMITQIFLGKNDKERYSTVIRTADKPTLIASLLECDSLIKTQQFGDPEWGEHSYKGKYDKKGAPGKDTSGKTYWEKVTKADVKNLKLADSGKKRHPCAGDLAYTKHDWAPGTGAVGRFNERGTQYTARVHGISMMGYALGTIANRHMEMNSRRPLRDTPRDGIHGGRQCRLHLTRSRRAEER